jgi:hypothetical protein
MHPASQPASQTALISSLFFKNELKNVMFENHNVTNQKKSIKNELMKFNGFLFEFNSLNHLKTI